MYIDRFGVQCQVYNIESGIYFVSVLINNLDCPVCLRKVEHICGRCKMYIAQMCCRMYIVRIHYTS